MKLIALDLDGTLLNSDKVVSERNAAALSLAAAQGNVIAPATGRALRAIPEQVMAFPFVHYAITIKNAFTGFRSQAKKVNATDNGYVKTLNSKLHNKIHIPQKAFTHFRQISQSSQPLPIQVSRHTYQVLPVKHQYPRYQHTCNRI